MNPAITSIWKITHRNPFISFIFYSSPPLPPIYCLLLFSPMDIKDMIRATFKQATNMTSIFLHVMRRRCCRGNSGGDILNFLDYNLQKEQCFRSSPFSGGRPNIVLYRISLFNVKPISEGQHLWIVPQTRGTLSDGHHSPADHFVLSCFSFCWCWFHSTASES